MARQPDAKHQRLGGKVGPKVATVVSKAMSEHERRTSHTRAHREAEALHIFWRDVANERDVHAAPLLKLLLGHENTPPELEQLLRFMHGGRGELAGMLVTRTLGTVAATGVSGAISNIMAPLIHKLNQEFQYQLLSPGDAAQAVATGLWPYHAGATDASGAGLGGERFSALVELARQYPDLSSLLELIRRQEVDPGEAHGLLMRHGLSDNAARKLLLLAHEHLAPADAALAVLRGNISMAEGEGIAAHNGINRHDFTILVENTGEPPGLMQLLEAFRRGFVDKSRLERGIRQSRVRNEWIDVVERLRFVPASTSDAIMGVIKGHLAVTRAKTIADHNGLDPSEFDWLLKSNGNPISNMQALTLYNRGQMSKSRVEQAIREGRTKNEYINDVINLRVKYPPPFQVVKMVQTGAISTRRAVDILLKEGYPKDVAEGLVHTGSIANAAKPKSLAVSMVETLYEEKAITEAEALARLHTLGYSTANAKLAVRVADLRRRHKLIQAAIAPIRASYIARHISEGEASTMLDKLRIPHEQRDLLLATWAIDREAKKAVLTPAQITRANEQGIINDHDAEQRLVNHGYTLGDARILLQLEKRRTKPVP